MAIDPRRMSRFGKEDWLSVEPLLDELLDLDEPARAKRLAALAFESPDLAVELGGLLAGEQRPSLADRFETDLTGVRASFPLEGATIGPYRLVRRLGSGGMGTVWLAERSDGRFDGLVAMKLLNLALVGHGADQRFQREGSVLARLSHPGIARLLDAGVTPAGQPYLVLEYVDGRPLDQYCDHLRLGVAERIGLVLEIMGAVSHAHQNLVVHRDIKPANILVTNDGRPKLLDFGIAKLLESEDGSAEHTDLTRVSGRALTPGYAAPEQVTDAAVTTATDGYSLGVVLQLLLSGEHPTGAAATSAAEMLRSVVDQNATRLSEGAAASPKHLAAQSLAQLRNSSPERLRRTYQGDLDNILGKALKKAPAERHASVGDFAADLERYLRHEPVSARPDSAKYRFGKFARRNRGPLAVAALVAFALIGAAAFSIRQMHEARRQRDEAVYHAARADAQIEFQELMMTDVGDRPLTMREILDRGRDLLIRQHPGDPRFQAAIVTQLSTAYAALGESKVRGELLARAESLARVSRDSAQLIEAMCLRADNFRSMGQYPEAREVFADVWSLMRRFHDPSTEASCLLAEAQVDVEASKGDSALPRTDRALAIFKQLGDSTSAMSIEATAIRATALEVGGRLGEAGQVTRQVVAAMDRSGRGELMAKTIYLHNLGIILRNLGRTAGAESVLREVTVRAAQADPTGRLPNQALIHYAAAALYQGHADTALKYFGKLEGQAVADSTLYWEGRARFGIALAQIQLGKLEEGRASMARFDAIAKRRNLTSSDDEVYDREVLEARLAAVEGHPDRARTGYMNALTKAGYSAGKRRSIFRSALIGAVIGHRRPRDGAFDGTDYPPDRRSGHRRSRIERLRRRNLVA